LQRFGDPALERLAQFVSADADGVEFPLRVAAASTVIVEGWPLERFYCIAAGTSQAGPLSPRRL
jgi:hypothetical protein